MSLHSAFLVYAKEYFRNPDLRARLSSSMPYRDSSDFFSPLRPKLYVTEKEKHELKNELKNLSSTSCSI